MYRFVSAGTVGTYWFWSLPVKIRPYRSNFGVPAEILDHASPLFSSIQRSLRLELHSSQVVQTPATPVTAGGPDLATTFSSSTFQQPSSISVRTGNQSQPLGQGQLPNNLPPHLPPQIPNMFPPIDHAEGGDENQPHNSAHNSTSTTNQDVVTTQLAAMQQHFTQQQDPQPVQHALALSEYQGQSHIAPDQQPLPDNVTRRLDSLEKLVAEQQGASPPHHNTDSIPHPLNTNITLEPYLASFKIPQLETYDGTKDPDDQLHAFYSCMQA
ncbi:hypothetical protein SLEP1_g39545 [Rubroshorea leprosula]|uniref:Uncharacterized protein n=1 Tax=Rubroshorea leprosula TaxID=152421 RepID=A0AAV5L163_9ROSI|nr:hypothetical protein SLEP1_g39545 [Rubroshorea leprosula]